MDDALHLGSQHSGTLAALFHSAFVPAFASEGKKVKLFGLLGLKGQRLHFLQRTAREEAVIVALQVVVFYAAHVLHVHEGVEARGPVAVLIL